ncbi:MAG: hypothetical protein QOI10_1619 [Solirubrobacterales bacterium]|jgi:lipoprotein-anchoring transpeptidase ErfK/SrfK|nr:hypothetical protein [Solirubrobacterales bacterium]
MLTVAGRPRAAAALIAILALAGCGGSGGDSSSTTASSTAAQATTSTGTGPTAQGRQAGAGQGGGQGDKPHLYFTAGEQFLKVPVDLPKSGDQVEAAAKALVAGPGDTGDVETQIPDQVEVQGVNVEQGTATVRVSSNFFSGIPPNPAARSDLQRQEIAARLGQVTYTLTQFDGVKSVKVVAGGEPAEQQIDRADFAPPQQGPDYGKHAKGPQSPSTRQLQERLADLQYLPRSAVDGVAGYRTDQAVIAFQAWEGLERDAVVGPATTAALAKAKPPRPQAGGPSRRIEVHRDKGVALLIAHDRVKRAIHVAAGAPATATPAGTFEVYRKERRSWSVPFQVWLPYASYFTGGIAFHEYPDVPPFPASHGCVRVPSPEAPGVYRFAKLGTTVVVL